MKLSRVTLKRRYEYANKNRLIAGVVFTRNFILVKVSSQSRKFEFNVFSIIHLNDHNF